MRTAIGGTLFTVGCLLVLGALLSVAWAAGWIKVIDSPGAGGFPSLLAFALFGWSSLVFLLAFRTMRNKAHSAPGQLLVLGASVTGALFGCGVYFFYEMRLGYPQEIAKFKDEVKVRNRGFGTIFEMPGGSRVKWTSPDGRGHQGISEGAEAKATLWVIFVGTVYSIAGGLFAGSLTWLGFGRPRPSEASDYDDKMPRAGPQEK